MDPITGISLAASAAQIADLAFKVFANIVKYYRNLRDAPAHSAKLRMELDSLVDLLNSVQEVFERHPHDLYRSALAQELDNLRQLLQRLYCKTDPTDTKGVRRLKWPFQQEENLDILSALDRFRANLCITLNINETYNFVWFVPR
jgi:hypothetical protein